MFSHPHVLPAILRHTCAAMSGDLRAVQELLGHAVITAHAGL